MERQEERHFGLPSAKAFSFAPENRFAVLLFLELAPVRVRLMGFKDRNPSPKKKWYQRPKPDDKPVGDLIS